MIKKEAKTKNDYFRGTVLEVISWRLKPKIVPENSLYSRVENLKFLKNKELGFFCGVERNRTGSNEAKKNSQVTSLEISRVRISNSLEKLWIYKIR